MRISSKREMYLLFQAGAFGNKLATWPDVPSLLASDFRGKVGLRYAVPAGPCIYDVPVEQVPEVAYREFENHGYDPRLIKPGQMAPDQYVALQGEIFRTHRGLETMTSTRRGQMRQVMPFAEHHEGFAARALLEFHIWPGSLDDIEALLELYDGAVVEFSAYSREVGTIPGRNTIIWEVRHY